jgi:signal transduction histidine kinase
MWSAPMDDDLNLVRAAYEERVRVLTQTLEKRDQELGILADVAARVHGESDVPRILDIALEEIVRQMKLQTAWVFMGDEKEKKLQLAASRGVNPAYLEEIETAGLGDCLCPEVFWTGHRMQARNTTQCPRMPTIVQGLAEPVAHACVPLRFEGHSRGVLNVAARPGEVFSEDELRFLETLGHQVCIAVERASHLRAEILRNEEGRALAAINKAIGGSLAVPAVLKAVGDTAGSILGAEELYIFLGSDPRAAKVGYLSGRTDARIREGQLVDLAALGWDLAVTALGERRPVRTDEREKALAVPLVTHEAVRGVLLIMRKSPPRWTEAERELAESLAAQASVAIEKARLYEEARRAYQDLKDAQERILQAEKMAVLGTFASGLAHEVRNPLNSMGLQLSILERRLARSATGSPGDVAETVGVIREEIKRLDSLVGDFLLFSRPNRMQYGLVSLDALVDDVTRLLRPEARAAGVTLRRQPVGDELPEIRMDAERMKQVVINLLRNAIEAMDGRGGQVLVETGLVDGRARIVVQDDGPGLPTDLDVFQLFVTTKDKGTGLGLSIAQQIVLEHGGEITASSESGPGATFTISLPIEPPTEPRQEGRKP